MKVSLVISTYNWKEALALCLQSVKKQTLIPFEVIVADDGSREDTKALIDEMRKDFPCTLKHVWHEDNGFRLSVIRNKAFAQCEGDYVIEVDGDIIMHSHFVFDHAAEAREGYFLTGSRGKISEDLSKKLLQKGGGSLHFYTSGISRRFNVFRCPLMTPFFYNYKLHKKERGCNISFWKKDLFAVNGCDEKIIGYGFEDIDFCARLRRLGIKKRFIKFKAIEFHIYHKAASSKQDMTANEKVFEENNKMNIIKCEKGISQYLS